MRKSAIALACTGCVVICFCFAATTASSAQSLTTLYTFDFTHGRSPLTSLVQGLNGTFYSTTSAGGNSDDGTAYNITPQGTLRDLYSFCYNPITGCSTSYGANPYHTLILGIDGNFYGITGGGGANTNAGFCQFGCGTVFKITPGGNVSLVYDFCSQQNCTDGADPIGLIQGADGNFYGATQTGGANTLNCAVVSNLCGTVFKLTPQGVLTTLYSFCSNVVRSNCTDGGPPASGVIQASNGNFYGTTVIGGPSGGGVIFEITPAGQYSILKSFTYPNGPSFNNGLMQASNGNLYGATFWGGYGAGSIFQITLAGKFTTLYAFCAQSGCPDGYNPIASLVQGTDGGLYGMTQTGGLHSNSNDCSTGCGTIFSLSPQGKFTNLYNFCSLPNCADGYQPSETLFQGTDGKFYGVTFSSEGTVFSFDAGLGPFIESLPAYGKVGRSIGILGNNLISTTSVSFNGTPATFTVVSDTLVTATVPAGATSGVINLTTSTGTLTTKTAFVVR